jgi:uncharacterized RDD family membrane protein YckC
MDPQQPPTPQQPPATPPPAAPLQATPPQPAPPQQPPPQQPMAGQTPPPTSWQGPPIETGPAPGVRFAGYGARLVAYIIDGILLGIVITILSVVFVAIIAGAAASDSGGAAIGSTFIYVFLILLLSLLYFPWFWAHGGQTPGMRMFNIRVVRDADGGPIGWGPAILRLIGYWVNSAVLYIGFIWVFVDKRRRGWHDLIAGTVVIEI